MKITRIEELINNIDPINITEYKDILHVIQESIKSIVWPPDSTIFTIYPEKKGNGVKPIKTACMQKLEIYGWRSEVRLNLGVGKRPGPIDSIFQSNKNNLYALEWETGNISSSHRALNKMVIGLMTGELFCGFLVLPSRKMYNFLTDRVGNFQELEPYFPVWRRSDIRGKLVIIEIEHEAESIDVPKIKKGTDGRALI